MVPRGVAHPRRSASWSAARCARCAPRSRGWTLAKRGLSAPTIQNAPAYVLLALLGLRRRREEGADVVVKAPASASIEPRWWHWLALGAVDVQSKLPRSEYNRLLVESTLRILHGVVVILTDVHRNNLGLGVFPHVAHVCDVARQFHDPRRHGPLSPHPGGHIQRRARVRRARLPRRPRPRRPRRRASKKRRFVFFVFDHATHTRRRRDGSRRRRALCSVQRRAGGRAQAVEPAPPRRRAGAARRSGRRGVCGAGKRAVVASRSRAAQRRGRRV
mmetsp:Transcript_8387/g.34543  ORF Transcript_8387/g.34543 Transcript_8387/m.34543 type:complete len:274 (+) Transcript_8387:72-893(+)